MSDDTTKLPSVTITAITATKATNDPEIIASWVANFRSVHTRRNFETTALRFLAALDTPLRQATVEDVRTALERLTAGLAPSSARQQVLRIKSLLSYGRRLGYLQFNAGAVIKVQGDPQSVAQRIVSEVEMGLLVRAAGSRRDRILIETAYAGGLRVSEVVGLTWSDVIPRVEKGVERVQLNVLGKRGKVRQVLLPEVVSRSLLSLRADAGPGDPVFRSQRTGGRLTERAVNHMLKATAARAGVNPKVSSHWLRHAHASHALDHDATLAEVQATLGHGNIATTSAYLHARPDSSSGLKLDKGIFLR
jgi:site-specific recombinase XerD